MQEIRWHSYHDYYDYDPFHDGRHSVSGRLLIAPDLHSPQLDNDRYILAHLPPSYDGSDRRYPVLYMHDGQNLFDNATSYAGEWGVDETMQRLAYEEGLEAIIIALPNMGVERVDEYSPFNMPRLGGGRGYDYMRFLAETVKPLVDATFRTLPEREHTGLMGSSLGGLISLYGYFSHIDTFGFAGVMSPSLWFGGDAIYDCVDAAPFRRGRIYLDAGTRELGEDLRQGMPHKATSSRRYYASVRRMKRLLIRKGFRPVRDLLHVEEKWAGHSESSWGRRLPGAIRFFLTGDPNPVEAVD